MAGGNVFINLIECGVKFFFPAVSSILLLYDSVCTHGSEDKDVPQGADAGQRPAVDNPGSHALPLASWAKCRPTLCSAEWTCHKALEGSKEHI